VLMSNVLYVYVVSRTACYTWGGNLPPPPHPPTEANGKPETGKPGKAKGGGGGHRAARSRLGAAAAARHATSRRHRTPCLLAWGSASCEALPVHLRLAVSPTSQPASRPAAAPPPRPATPTDTHHRPPLPLGTGHSHTHSYSPRPLPTTKQVGRCAAADRRPCPE
jgi:hypothetical protein